MSIKRLFTILAISLAGLSVFSCKEKDEETTYESFTGSVSFSFPQFVAPGQRLTAVPTGVSRKDGGDYGIVWSATTVPAITDTVKREGSAGDGKFSFTVPLDSCYSFTVTCKYYAEGFYSTTNSQTLTIADPNRLTGSLRGLELDDLDFVYTDPRDGHKYYCITTGNKDWFKENLAYAPLGKPYYNCEAMKDVTGCYYTWSDAQKACPEGWHLATQQDWLDLLQYVNGNKLGFGKNDTFTGMAGQLMGDCYFNGEKMWEFWPEVKITNKTGVTAIPMGYAIVDQDGTFAYHNSLSHAAFWTGDECDAERAYYRYLYDRVPDFMVGAAYKDEFAANVRCVR